MRFDTESPERGWAPFVEWLAAQSVDPTNCFAIDVGEGQAVVHEYARNAKGEKFAVGDELAKAAPRTVPIACLPPLNR